MTKVNEELVGANAYTGTNDADNPISTALVVANEDGSVIERLEQIQEAINKGSGTPVATNKSVVDALGTNGTTVADSAVSVLGAIGANNNDNAFASNTVVANADGSVLEREEFIQTKIAELKAIEGALTDAANLTAATATLFGIIRKLQETLVKGTGTAIGADLSVIDLFGAFDGGADPQGDIYQALGVGATKSIATLIADAQAVVGLLTDAADETASTATVINLLRAILARMLPREVYKTVAFTAGVGTGDIGTVALFTITGAVRIKITAICTENIAGAATLECGIAGSTAGIIAQIAAATDLIAGELWYDATPTTKIDAEAAALLEFILGDGQDIFLTIGAANITDGTIIFKIVWEPLIPTGAVVAA